MPLPRLFHALRPLPLLTLLAQAACVSPPPQPAYRGETFNSESPYEYWSTRAPEAACELGKRALLSQGYQIDDSKPQRINGEKFFQPLPDHEMKLNITLVCLPSNVGAVMYANAQQTRFELKARANSAGVSLAGLGSISLPWASDKENLVKVGEETIADPDFYRRLFALIAALDG